MCAMWNPLLMILNFVVALFFEVKVVFIIIFSVLIYLIKFCKIQKNNFKKFCYDLKLIIYKID